MKAQEKLDVMIAQAQDRVIELEALKSTIAAELQEQYDAGFSAGAASVGSDAIYTEEQLQAKISEAVLPLQAQIEEFPNQIQTAVEQAKVELKAELLADYEAAQASESSIEAAFLSKLKTEVVPQEGV